MEHYYPPTFNKSTFNCPVCNAFAHHSWFEMRLLSNGHQYIAFPEGRVSKCYHCKETAYWHNEIMLYPESSPAPVPHDDLPEHIKPDYLEARSIVQRSPRGAAALLRLCLQKLMVELGESGRDINKDIGSLVAKGLPQEVQQALDIVRVVGNESVHPGELDLRDDQQTAVALFELLNFIVEDRIAKKKKIGSLFANLPAGKLQGIQQRDAKNT